MKRRTKASLPESIHNDTGSPQSGEPVYIAVGFLRRPHGVRGEILMDLMTDFPDRLRSGRHVYLGESHEPGVIKSARGHDSGFLVTLQGVSDIDSAGKLRNTMVYVRADELPKLPDGQYYHHQLIGISVYDNKDHLLGVLSEILETGANDVYVISRGEDADILIPVINDVIQSVDIEKREMRIIPPEWE